MGYYADKSTGRGQLYLVTREGTKLFFFLIFFFIRFQIVNQIEILCDNELQMFSNDEFSLLYFDFKY